MIALPLDARGQETGQVIDVRVRCGCGREWVTGQIVIGSWWEMNPAAVAKAAICECGAKPTLVTEPLPLFPTPPPREAREP